MLHEVCALQGPQSGLLTSVLRGLTPGALSVLNERANLSRWVALQNMRRWTFFPVLISLSDHILELAASPDHYAVLGISEQASQAEIKEAYHRKILAAHPDRTRSTSSIAADLNEAYACLNDSERRSAYDISRKQAQSKAVHSES